MIAARLCLAFALASLVVAPDVAAADPATTHVRIAKLYSAMDATVQAIELEVVRVGGTPLTLAGVTVSTRDRFGNVKAFVLSGEADGPNPPDRLMILGSIWVDTNDSAWGPYADLLAPKYFLPIDGATLTVEGMDSVTYEALPLDDVSALDRNAQVVAADFGRWGRFEQPMWRVVREYYNAGLDHYFMTSRADEMTSLLRGHVPGWVPTEHVLYLPSYKIHSLAVPVCRYLLNHPTHYSHFFSASQTECAIVGASAETILESDAVFYAGYAPEGRCDATVTIHYPNGSRSINPIGVPVYRLWNGKAPANHRYVIDRAEREAMVARGWVAEGDGDGVVWCGNYVTGVPPFH